MTLALILKPTWDALTNKEHLIPFKTFAIVFLIVFCCYVFGVGQLIAETVETSTSVSGKSRNSGGSSNMHAIKWCIAVLRGNTVVVDLSVQWHWLNLKQVPQKTKGCHPWTCKPMHAAQLEASAQLKNFGSAQKLRLSRRKNLTACVLVGHPQSCVVETHRGMHAFANTLFRPFTSVVLSAFHYHPFGVGQRPVESGRISTEGLDGHKKLRRVINNSNWNQWRAQ